MVRVRKNIMALKTTRDTGLKLLVCVTCPPPQPDALHMNTEGLTDSLVRVLYMPKYTLCVGTDNMSVCHAVGIFLPILPFAFVTMSLCSMQITLKQESLR